MKIRITKCSGKDYWYKTAVGKEIECLRIDSDGDARISGEVVDDIDGGYEGAGGIICPNDFEIVPAAPNVSGVEHLKWIYGRMIQIHGENENVDYMLRFKDILGKLS